AGDSRVATAIAATTGGFRSLAATTSAAASRPASGPKSATSRGDASSPVSATTGRESATTTASVALATAPLQHQSGTREPLKIAAAEVEFCRHEFSKKFAPMRPLASAGRDKSVDGKKPEALAIEGRRWMSFIRWIRQLMISVFITGAGPRRIDLGRRALV